MYLAFIVCCAPWIPTVRMRTQLTRSLVPPGLPHQVGLPYIRSKAQALFESMGGGLDPELVARRDDDLPPDNLVRL
jgi:hypothetical protein